MDLFSHFEKKIQIIVRDLIEEGHLPDSLGTSSVKAEPPRDPTHGDITTNVAMVLAKPANRAPKELAEIISERIAMFDQVSEVVIAGPGFINFNLEASFWHGILKEIIKLGVSYGNHDFGKGARVNVEFVSANPTGPLHVAHARGAVIGDVLGNLLSKVGYEVTKEYYINDAGTQVDKLALSTHLRYREILVKETPSFAEGFYPGEYLVEIAKLIAERDGEKWLGVDKKFWVKELKGFVINEIVENIKRDLSYLGIHHDVFSKESALIKNRVVEGVVEKLEKNGLIYEGVLEKPKGKQITDWEPRNQKLFRATKFDDEVDRPLQKSDGAWTYFANDIAYHFDKYNRGFTKMINIFGADHGGYVKRMQAATKAVSDNNACLEIKLCQIVHLKKGGKPLRMSKRAGNFVTLRELIDSVGKDVVRFFMLTRKNDTQMDFDLEKVLDQSKDNPIFYVQYAHARCCSVLRHAIENLSNKEISSETLEHVPLDTLNHPLELQLAKTLASWPRFVMNAAIANEPHRITNFLNDVATAFHSLWNKGNENAELRFIQPEAKHVTLARLALIKCVALTISSGLAVCGIEPMDELR